MSGTGGTEGVPPPGRRRGRRSKGTPRPRLPNGAVRADIVLHKKAYETIVAEMADRGLQISDTIGSIINEWRLLQGVARASEFRHAVRGDVNALVTNTHLVATKQGRDRDAALKEVDRARNDLVNRLVLVTAL